MPQTVAPPPFNGDAAVGPWSSASRTSEPALQTPAAASRTAAAGVASSAGRRTAQDPAPFAGRHTADGAPSTAGRDASNRAARSAGRAVAAGVGLSAGALLSAGTAVATAAALRLLFSGDGRMTFDLASSALLLAGFAAAAAATLAAPNRWAAARPATLVLAGAVSAAWPLSGYPLAAAPAAVIAVGLALAHDIRRPGGRRVRGPAALGLLAGLAAALVIAGLALAETHRIDREPVESSAPRRAEPSMGAAPADGARSRDRARSVPGARDDGPAEPAGKPAPRQRNAAADRSAATPAIPGPDPETFVRDYYEHLNAERFEEAWASLSAGVRASFGGFDGWRSGYGRTISSTPGEFSVDGSTVTHVLVARDRGCPDRRFRVRWHLEPAGGAWSVAALSARPLDDAVCR